MSVGVNHVPHLSWEAHSGDGNCQVVGSVSRGYTEAEVAPPDPRPPFSLFMCAGFGSLVG